MPYALKALKAQMGLSPRRGRSLSESWTNSGACANRRSWASRCRRWPDRAGGEPAEHALNAVAAAWELF